MFQFQVVGSKGSLRSGVVTTSHGKFSTPSYMPVGTSASVKSLDSVDVSNLGADVMLANTYHLHLRPGENIVTGQGGVQEFMKWEGAVLTDSGGFQVFSLGQNTKIGEDGVVFQSHIDGNLIEMTPESSMEVQRKLGADIIMAFDECTPDDADVSYAREAIDRTHRWAVLSKEAWEKSGRLSAQGKYQAMFGIIQGGMHKNLRRESVEFIVSQDFDGIAIGGETIGFNMEGTMEVLSWIRDLLPDDKPIYMMGVGRDPQNLVDIFTAGVDMSDCVAPTRLARNGSLYHGELRGDKFESEYSKSRLQIGNAVFKKDSSVILDGCDCYTCKNGYTRSYLNHLFKAKELSYYRLASIHNLRVMMRIGEELRKRV